MLAVIGGLWTPGRNSGKPSSRGTKVLTAALFMQFVQRAFIAVLLVLRAGPIAARFFFLRRLSPLKRLVSVRAGDASRRNRSVRARISRNRRAATSRNITRNR